MNYSCCERRNDAILREVMLIWGAIRNGLRVIISLRSFELLGILIAISLDAFLEVLRVMIDMVNGIVLIVVDFSVFICGLSCSLIIIFAILLLLLIRLWIVSVGVDVFLSFTFVLALILLLNVLFFLALRVCELISLLRHSFSSKIFS